jgi:CheY-like chemotaxis protein
MTSTPPPQPIPVALLGFSSFERSAMLARFQRPARGADSASLGFEWVLGVDEARFVVADGDQPGALALLEQLGRVDDAVFVGSYAPRRAAAWLMRPLAPDAVLRELAELQRQRALPDSAPLPLPMPWLLGNDFGRLDRRSAPSASRSGRLAGWRADDGRAVLPVPGHLPPDAALRQAGARPEAGATTPRTSAPLVLPRALLVDDSDIALHYLRRLLAPYGLDTDLAHFSHQALEMLASRVYGIVFVDVDLGEGSRHDGLDLCHRVRHQWQQPGAPPVVVVVSAMHDPVHQVRGTLAGAQAYLGKPLDRGALDQLMQRLGFASAVGRPGLMPGAGPRPPQRPPR